MTDSYYKRNENAVDDFFGDGIEWRTRGVGVGYGISLLTGNELHAPNPDMSGFVNSRAEGLLLVQMFKGRAFLDYRPSEPNYLQVKVCVERKDEKFLVLLHKAVQMLKGRLTATMLQAVYTEYERELENKQPIQSDTLNPRMCAWAEKVQERMRERASVLLDKIAYEKCASANPYHEPETTYQWRVRDVQLHDTEEIIWVKWEELTSQGWRMMDLFELTFDKFFKDEEGKAIDISA